MQTLTIDGGCLESGKWGLAEREGFQGDPSSLTRRPRVIVDSGMSIGQRTVGEPTHLHSQSLAMQSQADLDSYPVFPFASCVALDNLLLVSSFENLR